MVSPSREDSFYQTLPALDMGGPSQAQQRPTVGEEQSTASTDDEKILVSFVDIMNAAEDAASQFEGERHSENWWPGPWFQMRAPRRSIAPPWSSLMVPPVLNSRRTMTPMGVQGCTHKRSSSSQKTPMRMTRLTS